MGLKLPQEENCPDQDKHTPCPEDYILWHEWAAEKGKTHRQIRCAGCNLFTIWVPKLKVIYSRAHGQTPAR
jgi:hypothetical protein